MRIPRKLALTVLASVAVAGLAGASAASLGAVSSENVGAGDTSVGSCDSNGVDVSYDTTFRNNQYEISNVHVSNVDVACDGQVAGITLRDAAGDPVGPAITVSPIVLSSGSFSAPVTGVSALALEGVSILIEG